MKKISIVWLLLCSIIGGLSAQHIELKGLVREAKTNEALAFVNAVLQRPDSAFVTGAVSDDNGKFAIPNLKPGDYRLALSFMGYKTLYIEVAGLTKNLALPDILMEEEAVGLDAVTVTGSATTSRIDRKLIFPSDRQVKASINGVDLLKQLMLPRVQVNPMTNDVTLPGGGEVQLRINGVRVEKEDVLALQPADITRVEYHDSPGLRYGNAEAVIDFITRRRETGGNIGVNIQNSFHLKKLGYYSANGKINHKRSEFSVLYSLVRRDYDQWWRDNEETFTFADGSILRRREEGTPSRFQHSFQNLSLAYSYMDDKRMFHAIVRHFLYNGPHDADYRGTVYDVAHSEDQLQMADLTKGHIRRYTPELYYQENLKNGQTLVFNLIGSYARTGNTRIYQESREGLLQTNVLNHVTGNRYSWIGEGIYEKKLGKNNLSAGLRHSQAFSDNTYLDSREYHTEMHQSETFLYGEWKGKINKLDYMLGIGATRSFLRQENEKEGYENYTFNPRLTLFCPLSGDWSIRLKGSVSNETPSLAELSAVEQVIDSFQIQRGNPSLKPYLFYNSELNSEWKKGIFYASLQLGYIYFPSAIMEEKFLENNKIIWTWNNQKNWRRLSSSIFLRVGPVKDILQFSINGGFNRYISHGNHYRHVYNNPYMNAQMEATYKNFSANFMWNISSNNFYGETVQGGESMHVLTLNYKHNQMVFEFLMLGPFTNNWYIPRENWSAFASYKRKMYCNDFSRLAMFRLVYNFSFGRKFQSGQQRISNSDNDTGVMKAGK
jgi:hypothetical protein